MLTSGPTRRLVARVPCPSCPKMSGGGGHYHQHGSSNTSVLKDASQGAVDAVLGAAESQTTGLDMERTVGVSIGDERYDRIASGSVKRRRRNNVGRFAEGALMIARFLAGIGGTSSGKRDVRALNVKGFYITLHRKIRAEKAAPKAAEAPGDAPAEQAAESAPEFDEADLEAAAGLTKQMKNGLNLLCAVTPASPKGATVQSFLDETADMAAFREKLDYCLPMLDDVARVSFEAVFITTLAEALDADDIWDANFEATKTLAENIALIAKLENAILVYRRERTASTNPIPANVDKSEATVKALAK